MAAYIHQSCQFAAWMMFLTGRAQLSPVPAAANQIACDTKLLNQVGLRVDSARSRSEPFELAVRDLHEAKKSRVYYTQIAYLRLAVKCYCFAQKLRPASGNGSGFHPKMLKPRSGGDTLRCGRARLWGHLKPFYESNGPNKVLRGRLEV